MSIIPIIIPAYEPDEKLITLLDSINEKQVNQPVYIIDDGSRAECQKIFDTIKRNIADGVYDNIAAGVKLLAHAVNLGKGRALKSAMNEALNDYPDLLGCVTIDSDGQHTIKDMNACMEALKKNPESLILGCRDFTGKDVPKRSSFGNNTTKRVMKLLVGLSVSDTQTGLRAIPREYMKNLLAQSGERYEFETNMLINTREYGIDIVEVPIETVYIEENKSSHFNPFKDSLKIYALFIKFIISSLSSSLLDFALFALFCKCFREKTFAFLDYIVISTIAARIISATYNFIINYKTVFKSSASVTKAICKYAALAVVIMLASGFIVDAIHSCLPVAELAIKIPVDVLLFLASFWVQREFVYK